MSFSFWDTVHPPLMQYTRSPYCYIVIMGELLIVWGVILMLALLARKALGSKISVKKSHSIIYNIMLAFLVIHVLLIYREYYLFEKAGSSWALAPEKKWPILFTMLSQLFAFPFLGAVIWGLIVNLESTWNRKKA
jgi:hypothetical protein